MSSKSIWLRKSAPVKDRCGQTHNCVVVGMAPPEDVASKGPMRPKMHKTTGSNGLLRLRLGSDRVREARPVLLVGNFDWIGSASRSLRFTARTAPRLRRRSGATRTGGAAIPPMIESDTSRPTVTSVAARLCRRCRQRRPLSHRRQLRPRSRLAQTTLPGSCDWYARRSSAP